jgi:hypothetical protein
MTLPAGYSLRRPRPDDAEAIASVMTASLDAVEELSADDVRREWRQYDVENDVWLVESAGAHRRSRRSTQPS